MRMIRMMTAQGIEATQSALVVGGCILYFRKKHLW